MTQADLHLVFGGTQDGVACDLGPGPGGGGNREDGERRVNERTAASDDLEMFEGV